MFCEGWCSSAFQQLDPVVMGPCFRRDDTVNRPYDFLPPLRCSAASLRTIRVTTCAAADSARCAPNDIHVVCSIVGRTIRTAENSPDAISRANTCAGEMVARSDARIASPISEVEL